MSTVTTPADTHSADSRQQHEPTLLKPLRLSPTVSLLRGLLVLLLTMSSTAILIFCLLPQLAASIRLLIAALVLLTLRHAGGLLVLLCLLLHLLLTEPQVRGRLEAENELVFCLAALTFLMFLWRQRPILQEAASRSLTAGLRAQERQTSVNVTLNLQDDATEQGADDTENRPVQLSDLCSPAFWSSRSEQLVQWQTAGIRGVLTLLVVTTVGCLTVALLPRGRVLTSQFREAIEAEPEMQSAALLLTIVIGIIVVGAELVARRLTAAEAQQLVRTQTLDVWYDDIWQIVRCRIAARQKRFARKPSLQDEAAPLSGPATPDSES